MRVVIVADHVSAKFGGEAFLPLHYFRLLRSRNIDTWLVAHSRTQTELQTLFPEAVDKMHFVSDTWLHLLLAQAGSRLPGQISRVTTGFLMHLYTQQTQHHLVAQLVREHHIDIVHQPSPVSPKEPSLMFGFKVPVVMGPMNGGMEYPPAFRDRQSPWLEKIIDLGRSLSNLFNRVFPGKLQAQTLLVANERTKQALPAGVSGTIIELVENGVDLSVWQPTNSVTSREVAHFVYVGRLVNWKAVDLLLDAFEPVAVKTGAILEIIGDGILRQELEAQAVKLNISKQVVFTGFLSQSECAAKMQSANALVLTSLWECGGAVVLEAMAMGLPVIATNWGGPADYLNSDCGFLIEPSSREALVNGFTDAMIKLAQSPDLRWQMGEAGQKLVQQNFDWERKIDCMIEIYQQTIAHQNQSQIS